MTRKRRCPTGWLRFSDELDARIALTNSLAKQALRKATRRREQRIYFCQMCRGWHLTTQDKRRPGEAR